MKRRSFVKAAALGGLAGELALRPARADVPDHIWDGYDFGGRPTVPDRLNQGPFGAGGDRTIHYTTPSDQPIKNYGLGLVGYTWEENGPALAVRAGKETLEQGVEKLASLPFMDVLYIRCDWRDVQKTPGRLDLNPVWKATLDAAKSHNLRVGFRVQLSSPNFQPQAGRHSRFSEGEGAADQNRQAAGKVRRRPRQAISSTSSRSTTIPSFKRRSGS